MMQTEMDLGEKRIMQIQLEKLMEEIELEKEQANQTLHN